jgi:hypothetical protein
MMSFQRKPESISKERLDLGSINYDFTIAKSKSTIKKITIDPSGLMADVKQ